MLAYILRCLIALDLFANVLTGGRIDETISSRVQRASDAHHSWKGILLSPVLLIEKLLVGLLDFIQAHHGINAESDDVARALVILNSHG